MSLINNQSYKKKIVFFKNEDDEKKVIISIGLSCNHEINKSMLHSIESHVNSLFFSDYIDEQTFKNQKMAEKLQDKQEKKNNAKDTKEVLAYKKRI